MVAAAVPAPPRIVLLPYHICGMILAPAPDRVLLLLRLFAMWLGANCDEPSHDAIVPNPRRGPALYPAVGALEDRNIARDHDNQGLIVDNQRFVSSIADQTTHLAGETSHPLIFR
jgi:hypothetical protein